MFGIHDLALFILSGLLLNLTPGADMLYIISKSTSHGCRAGIWAALGIGTGCIFHIVLATVGLSAILTTSALAFTVVKYVGVIYLVYMGVMLLITKEKTTSQNQEPSIANTSSLKIYVQGILINALNPKVALFFLAFLPQFIEASSQNKAAAFLTLGVIFNTTGTLWNIFVAWSASSVSRQMTNTALGQWLKKAMGALFIGLGAKLAVSKMT